LLDELNLAISEGQNLQKQNEFRDDVDSFVHLVNAKNLELASLVCVKLDAQIASLPCLSHLESIVKVISPHLSSS
jgi:hypothetical protein